MNPASYESSFSDMSAFTKGYSTNNKYPGFPPLMNDGRAVIAAYQPEADINNQLLKQSGVTSNFEYRQYLIHNATDIMRRNFEDSANDMGYYVNSDSNVSTQPSDDSDLKQMYMSREELQKRKVVHTLSPSDYQKLIS